MSNYKYSQSVGRLQNAGERVTVTGSGGQAGSVTHIPAYKPLGPNLGTSRIKHLQQLFKLTSHNDAPVFLRSSRDVLMYRGMMWFSIAGVALAMYGIGSMATGSMRKKN